MFRIKADIFLVLLCFWHSCWLLFNVSFSALFIKLIQLSVIDLNNDPKNPLLCYQILVSGREVLLSDYHKSYRGKGLIIWNDFMLQFMFIAMISIKLSVQDSLKRFYAVPEKLQSTQNHAYKYHSRSHCLHIAGKSHRQTVKIFKLFAYISRYELRKINIIVLMFIHWNSINGRKNQELSEKNLSLERNPLKIIIWNQAILE